MTGPLISADELATSLDEVTVLDVRWRMGGPSGREEYENGHVPGAAYVDLDADLAGTSGEGRHPLPEPTAFEAAMRRVGVRVDRPVVVYDAWGGRAAARCWWLLRWAGKTEVRVLDGGWGAWTGPVEVGARDPEPGDLVVSPGAMPTVDPDDVGTWPGVLVDARASERFRGETEPVDPVAGHIPGAVNVPTEANLDAHGRFRSPEELVAVYPHGEVAVYCGSGVTACHDILALAVGGRDATLYPGSWSGWVSDRSRPVDTGG